MRPRMMTRARWSTWLSGAWSYWARVGRRATLKVDNRPLVNGGVGSVYPHTRIPRGFSCFLFFSSFFSITHCTAWSWRRQYCLHTRGGSWGLWEMCTLQMSIGSDVWGSGDVGTIWVVGSSRGPRSPCFVFSFVLWRRRVIRMTSDNPSTTTHTPRFPAMPLYPLPTRPAWTAMRGLACCS